MAKSRRKRIKAASGRAAVAKERHSSEEEGGEENEEINHIEHQEEEEDGDEGPETIAKESPSKKPHKEAAEEHAGSHHDGAENDYDETDEEESTESANKLHHNLVLLCEHVTTDTVRTSKLKNSLPTKHLLDCELCKNKKGHTKKQKGKKKQAVVAAAPAESGSTGREASQSFAACLTCSYIACCGSRSTTAATNHAKLHYESTAPARVTRSTSKLKSHPIFIHYEVVKKTDSLAATEAAEEGPVNTEDVNNNDDDSEVKTFVNARFMCYACEKQIGIELANGKISALPAESMPANMNKDEYNKCLKRLKTSLSTLVHQVEQQVQRREAAAARQRQAESEKNEKDPFFASFDDEPPMRGRARKGKAAGDDVSSSMKSEEEETEQISKFATGGGSDRPRGVRGTTIKGLDNLGNTCFFNSVMQVMTHTAPQVDYFLGLSKTTAKQSNTNAGNNITSVYAGPLTCALWVFYTQMYQAKQQQHVEEGGGDNDNEDFAPAGKKGKGKRRGGGPREDRVYDPHVLFDQIGKKAPRFKTRDQQDAQELLRYLLDSAREEFIKRNEKEAKMAGITLSKKSDNNIIDSTFRAKLCSTIICHNCGNVSRTFEDCFDISVPIPHPEDSELQEKRTRELATGIANIRIKKNDAARRAVMVAAKTYLLSPRRIEQSISNESDSAKKKKPGSFSILDCLAAFAEREIIGGPASPDNGYFCEKCSKLQQQQQQQLESTFDTDKRVSAAENNTEEVSDKDEGEDESTGSTTEEEEEAAPQGKDQEEKEEAERGSKKDKTETTTKKASTLREASKQFSIYSAPEVLTLHIKRFKQTYHISKTSSVGGKKRGGGERTHISRSIQKDSTNVKFPLMLTLDPFITPNINNKKGQCNDGHNDNDHDNYDEESDNDNMEDIVEQASAKHKYRLYGVVVHGGSISGGHYIAYVNTLAVDNKQQQQQQQQQQQMDIESAAAATLSPRHDIAMSPVTPTTSATEQQQQQEDQESKKEQQEPDEEQQATINNNDDEDNVTSTPTPTPTITATTTTGVSLRRSDQWYYFSDTHVRPADVNEVLGAEAYLLFYERVHEQDDSNQQE